MKSILCLCIPLVALMVVPSSSVDACGYGPPSTVRLFAQADVVLIGEIIRIENQMQSIRLSANANNRHDMHVAIVKIKESIKGAEGLTHVRIAHFAHDQLSVGQERCFSLAQHTERPLYFLTGGSRSLKGSSRRVEQIIKEFKELAKLRNAPIQSLTSKDKNVRQRATALLLLEAKMRDWRTGEAQTTVMDKSISRLILKNLANFDWKWNVLDFDMHPSMLFSRLQLTAKDGWSPKFKGNTGFEQAAKRWLNDNADSFEITAFVRPQ